MSTELRNVGNIPHLLSNSLLSTTALWEKSAEAITPTELVAFVKSMEYEGYGREARANVALALDEIRTASARHEIGPTALMSVALNPPERLTVAELCTFLEELTVPRRRAVLWALEMELQPEDATLLTWFHWREVRHRASQLASQSVTAQPRHLFTDFVFWEWGKARPEPLQGLGKDAETVFGRPWPALASAYRNLVYLL